MNDAGSDKLKPKKLPTGTTHQQVVTKFVNRLRGRLYDIENAMTNVMRKKRGQSEFTAGDLQDIFTLEKIQVPPPATSPCTLPHPMSMEDGI